MAKQIPLEEAVGKTISGTAIGNDQQTCIIAFDDGTFSTIDASGYGGECCFELTSEPLEPLDFGDSKIIELGLYSKDALDLLRAAMKAKQRDSVTKCELSQLKHLIEKYGIPKD